MNFPSPSQLSSMLLVTASIAVGLACFSSPNHRIAFVSDVDGDSEVALLDVENGETISLTDNQSRDFDPRWSPNRELLAYVSNESGDLEVNLIDRKGESIIRLTHSAGDDISPR